MPGCELHPTALGNARQLHTIDRMLENGLITAAQAEQAKDEELRIRPGNEGTRVHGEFVAETVRQLMFAQYGEATYDEQRIADPRQ